MIRRFCDKCEAELTQHELMGTDFYKRDSARFQGKARDTILISEIENDSNNEPLAKILIEYRQNFDLCFVCLAAALTNISNHLYGESTADKNYYMDDLDYED